MLLIDRLRDSEVRQRRPWGRGGIAKRQSDGWRRELCWNCLDGVSGGMRVIESGSEVNRCLFSRLLGEALPSIDLAHGDLSRSKQGPEQHRRRLGRGQHGLCFDAALKLFVQ